MVRIKFPAYTVLSGLFLLFHAQASADKGEIVDRLKAAEVAFREIMAVPEKGIPGDLLDRAHCVVIIPGLKKGGFVVGAQYGKGFLTCRRADRSWSAPATIRAEGGSVGFQIGGGETDVFLLVMNESGAQKLMRSEFKIGAEAGVMAGPIGRSVQASTDAYMRAEMLGWSRSRGVFAGVALEGSTLRQDLDDNRELYGRPLTTEEIVHGSAAPPAEAKPLLDLLSTYSRTEKK